MDKPKKEKYEGNSIPINTWENIGRRWTLLILTDLKKHKILRFTNFKNSHPKLSNTILSNRLEKLRKLGLIDKKTSIDEKPIIEYTLTDSGNKLISFFDEFSSWALNLEKNTAK